MDPQGPGGGTGIGGEGNLDLVAASPHLAAIGAGVQGKRDRRGEARLDPSDRARRRARVVGHSGTVPTPPLAAGAAHSEHALSVIGGKRTGEEGTGEDGYLFLGRCEREQGLENLAGDEGPGRVGDHVEMPVQLTDDRRIDHEHVQRLIADAAVGGHNHAAVSGEHHAHHGGNRRSHAGGGGNPRSGPSLGRRTMDLPVNPPEQILAGRHVVGLCAERTANGAVEVVAGMGHRRLPSCSASAARARCKCVLTVPALIPKTAAISVSVASA